MAHRGELVAKQAREWIATPFVWGQSSRAGCDCKGLIQGIARELDFPEAETFYGAFASYRRDRKVPAGLLKEGLAAVFDLAEDIQPGDVLLLKHGGAAQHLAIATEDEKAVHAQIAPKAWVKETALRALLKLCPLDSIWRWRDGD